MQLRHESILRKVNNNSKGYNILTFPVHEAYSTGMSTLPHTFYLMRKEGVVKDWNFNYRPLPKNQIKPDLKFDICLSQNKFGNHQTIEPISKQLGIPLISLEHTLPVPGWTNKYKEMMSGLRGDLNLFISEFSVKSWGWSLDDPSVRVIHHGIDTELFKPLESDGHNDTRVLSVVNDWINRDWCCNFSAYKRICLDKKLPVNPVGDTPTLSKGANGIDDLVSKYQNALLFINTSAISPVPTALMEAMSSGCCCISTATCMIPEIIKDGENGFLSNDEDIIYDRLIWCLKNPEKAKEIGKAARETIIKRFGISKHVESWNNVINEAYNL